jgi:hypothetical protein
VRDLEEMPVVKSASAAFREVEALAKAWRDDNGPVRGTLRELENVAVELRQAIAAADAAGTGASLRAAGDGAAAAGTAIADLTRDLRGELQHLRRALAAIERFADLLERDPGALLHGRAPAASPLQKE